MAIKKRFPYKAAFVACNGGCRATADCQYGCVGCELCVNVCKFEAIALNEYGVAEVNEDKCIACGAIGIGEITSIPTAPAIADAYFRFDGERRTKLPLANTPYERKGK